MTALLIILAAAVLYVLSTMCRKGHPGLAHLQGWVYAHRGLHGNSVPENSMAAFRAAIESGYGIELDVHLMKDGNLAVIHDASLARTAGVNVTIEDMTAEDLPKYPLEGTAETIPLLAQVLELYAGKAPIIVELKTANGNYIPLAEAACALLGDYKGPYCIESFDPRCIAWLARNHPEIIRGQLAQNFIITKKSPLPPVIKFLLTHQMENFLTRPDFVSYRFDDRNTLSNKLVRQFWGAQGVSWTITSQEDLDTAVKEGWLPIFEGFRP